MYKINSNYLYSNYLYSNYLYSNYLYSNYLYSNYLYSNYLYSGINRIYPRTHALYINNLFLFYTQINLSIKFFYYKYLRQIKYNTYNITNIFKSFITLITKFGLFNKIYVIVNLYYNAYIHNYSLKSLYVYLHQFYTNMILILNALIPLNSFILTKINKKKKKNARLKNKYEKKIQYLPVYKRINFVYKWLKLDIICSAQTTVKGRVWNILNKLTNSQVNDLLIYKLKKKLHTLMLITFLKKKNK